VSATRVYVPSTLTLLQDVVLSGGVGPVPLRGHAVTEALRAQQPDASEEEWEYAASSAAAESALALLRGDDAARRVVLAVDCDAVRPVDEDDPTLVEVDEPVPLRRVGAVLVDGEDAADDVAAAVARLADALRGDAEALAVVERCLDHELGWYAAQEIGDLLDSSAGPE
jgi:hypothetical protein